MTHGPLPQTDHDHLHGLVTEIAASLFVEAAVVAVSLAALATTRSVSTLRPSRRRDLAAA